MARIMWTFADSDRRVSRGQQKNSNLVPLIERISPSTAYCHDHLQPLQGEVVVRCDLIPMTPLDGDGGIVVKAVVW